MIIDIRKLIKLADKKIDFKKFIKFGITGVINTGVDWLAFALLHEVFKIYSPLAQAIAHFIAIINSYIINKNWTFKNNINNKSNKKSEMLKFFIVQGTSLLLGIAGMFALNVNLGLNEYLSKAIISCVTLVINYSGNKLFVFK